MNILGIDFEDWFHPQIVQKYASGMKKEPSVIKGIDKVLDLLRANDTYATFFVVGELLEGEPTLLDKIIENGHEIAFHTMHHDRLDTKDKEDFEKEVSFFSEMTQNRSKGFRAPTFSLNYKSAWAVDVLAKHNYIYDSSVIPAKTSLYGLPNAETKPYRISSSSLEKNDEHAKLWEFPLTVGKFMGKKMPMGGGFYLRFLPIGTIKKTIQTYERQNIPATFYIHSWELTPEHMPKIKMSPKDSYVTYYNIKNAYQKMNHILKNFNFTSFDRYIAKYF